MGYSFDMMTNRLCCDACGKAEGTSRKVKCPFNYCYPPALCADCRKGEPGRKHKEYHVTNGCEKRHAEFTLELYREKEMLETGRYIRKAALGHGERCKVYFDHKDGGKCFWMPTSIYQKVGCGKIATLEDYQAIGIVTPATNENLYDQEVA